MIAFARPILVSASLGLALAGCAALGSSDQATAGLTIAEVEWCPSPGTAEKPFVCALRFRDGKEKEAVSLSLRHPSGIEVSYAANSVRAFDAIVARAEVEKALAAAGIEATPSLVDLVLRAVAGR